MKRTGWVLRNVKDCESISGHMYRMGMMSFLLDGSQGLDRIRVMELGSLIFALKSFIDIDANSLF